MFFFVKQTMAYEIRISDWSSDVCYSDLVISGEAAEAGTGVSPRYIYAGLKSRLASWPESTGKGDWFTGPDGVDRYEIDDSQSRFDDERFQEFNEYNKSLENGDQAIERLGNLLDHPELY